MFSSSSHTNASSTTHWKLVLPFYGYASLAFLVGTVLLLLSASHLLQHYFHPHSLAITHTMALGWGTMIILGASHQLVPVLIENKLYSYSLAWLSFVTAAIGIPLLVYGFWTFNMGWPAQWGGWLLVTAIVIYLVNLVGSMLNSKKENVHAFFILSATLWLLATAVVGLMLVYNFSVTLMPNSSLHYLPLHAHMGIVGWFLLLVIGVGSRLIPMFLISKYDSVRLLWWIFYLINGGLLLFVFLFLYTQAKILLLLPLLAVTAAIVLFGYFCYQAYKQRIRKKVDEQMQLSLLSVLLMLLPLLFLFVIIVLLLQAPAENIKLVVAYGFVIFFGWITAIIIGMTFKTLPFIIWNKAYHQLAGKGKTPNPKDLVNDVVFRWMSVLYVLGFVLFTVALLWEQTGLLQGAALLLVLTSLLYNWNVIKLLTHKPVLYNGDQQ